MGKKKGRAARKRPIDVESITTQRAALEVAVRQILEIEHDMRESGRTSIEFDGAAGLLRDAVANIASWAGKARTALTLPE